MRQAAVARASTEEAAPAEEALSTAKNFRVTCDPWHPLYPNCKVSEGAPSICCYRCTWIVNKIGVLCLYGRMNVNKTHVHVKQPSD